MLKARIMTALVLLAVFLPCVLAPTPTPLAALALTMLSLAAWEWLRLQGQTSRWSGAIASAFGAFGLLALVKWPGFGEQLAQRPEVWLCGTVVWTIALAVALAGGAPGWQVWPRGLRNGLGLSLLALAWLSVVSLQAVGVWMLVPALATIWLSDIGAYFGGRRLGKRKLAPAISPGKSWEGVWSGTALALAFALGTAAFDLGLYGHVQGGLGWGGVVGLCLGLVVLGVTGDLFESVLKRSAEVKDSSHLLPGHGGVLDRLDALLPAMPFATLMVSLT